MFQEMERQNKLGKFEHWDSSDVSNVSRNGATK